MSIYSQEEKEYFLNESNESLKSFESALKEITTSEEFNSENLKKVFRIAHTIEVGAKLLKHDQLRDLAFHCQLLIDTLLLNPNLVSDNVIDPLIDATSAMSKLIAGETVDINCHIDAIKEVTDLSSQDLN